MPAGSVASHPETTSRGTCPGERKRARTGTSISLDSFHEYGRKQRTSSHTDGDAWEQLGPVIFDDERWSAAAREVEAIEGLIGLQAPATVLDLACGPGRHVLELARRGYRVTGVDATETFIADAQARARSEGLDVELIHGDMREFMREGAFQAVINLSTSFGYFSEQQDDARVLANVWGSLSPGGWFVMELMSKEVVARTLKGPSWAEEGGVVLLTEQRVRDDWTWVDDRIVFLELGARREFTLSHRLYSAAELRGALVACGFTAIGCFGGLSGSPYDASATALVVTARRDDTGA
jgi:SAM-dependent methyltransferase